MKKIAVLASGNGSNFEALVKAVRRQKIPAEVSLMVTDCEKAYARNRAERLGVNQLFLNPKDYSHRQDFYRKLTVVLKKEKIDIVVLAGYMRILTADFVKTFKNRIINIHPAILPAFKGVDSIKRAYQYGCKVFGVTIHFVDEQIDNGPIILQGSLKINNGESLNCLESRIHKLEHKLYPQALELLVNNRLKVKGRMV
ncbi:MAG: phosphoribosylglycinamide formyltransferase, partial [Candidatus Omnitrophica bacterium]|nr:phosphoribosylglycinamide formyltransferase [Candidatus Omnitrophota bacterium]